MPDVVDAASQTIELELQARISAVRRHTGPVAVPKGTCHNCEAVLEAGKLFCEPVGTGLSECQVDYERRTKRRVQTWE
jgi:RNA polymerase-binding transcription factor DksA